MSAKGLYAWSNPWFRWSLVSLAVLTVLSILIGFVVLPAAHKDFTAGGIWAAICRAAGVPTAWAARTDIKKDRTSTDVILERRMARAADLPAAVGRGATLALNCTMCHGTQGMSTSKRSRPGVGRGRAEEGRRT